MFYKRHLSPLHRIDQAAFNGGFSPTATVEGDSKEERDGTMGDREGGGGASFLPHAIRRLQSWAPLNKPPLFIGLRRELLPPGAAVKACTACAVHA